MKELKTGILLTLLVVAYTEGIEDIGIAECNNEGYFNVIVSFWKKDPQTDNIMMLCVGALIRSDLIFATTECARTLHPYNEIGVQTGTMKLNEIYPVCILERTQELPSKSKFALVILNRHIKLLSIYNLNYVDESDYRVYDAVIVGWHHEEGPKAKPMTVTVGKTLSLYPINYNYSYVEFPPGSFVVYKKVILGFTHFNIHGSILFYKIPLQDMTNLKKFFQGELKSNIEPERPSEIEEVQISDESYLNSIVALCNATYDILCIGALIKPDCVMTINTCNRKLEPFNEIGVLTGTNYLKCNFALTKVSHGSPLHGYSKCHLVYLSEPIEQPHFLEVDWMKMVDNVSHGVIVGWTNQRGPVVIRDVIYDVRYQIRVKSYGGLCINETLLVGSFIAKGINIVGFVGTALYDEVTLNKVSQLDKKFLTSMSRKSNKALKRAAPVSEDFPPTKKSQYHKISKEKYGNKSINCS